MSGLVLLTSTGFKNPAVSNEIKNYLSGSSAIKNLKVTIITTAARDKERNPFVLKQKCFIEEQLKAVVEMVDIEFENDSIAFDSQDIIYIVGGNTFHLINCARTKNLRGTLQKFLCQNKIIVGASAGALILGPDISIAATVNPDDGEEDTQDYEGLGLVDEIIYPHYSVDVEKQITAFEKERNLVIKRLDNEAYLVTNPVRS
jgi:dipeptidase E